MDPSYQVRHRDFYSIGRVFALVMNEPAGANANPRNSTRYMTSTSFTVAKYQENVVFTSVRRFVVVQQRRNFCFACPIFTYQGRGTTKPGIRPEEHSVIYTYGNSPKLLPGEAGVYKSSIPVSSTLGERPLDESSRINFAICHPIQYNLKVKNIGLVPDFAIQSLLSNWKEEEDKYATSDGDIARNTSGAFSHNISFTESSQTNDELETLIGEQEEFEPDDIADEFAAKFNPYGFDSKLNPTGYHEIEAPYNFHPQLNVYGYHPVISPHFFHPEKNKYGYHEKINPQGYHPVFNPHGYDPVATPDSYHEVYNKHGYHPSLNKNAFHPVFNPGIYHTKRNPRSYHKTKNPHGYHPNMIPNRGVWHPILNPHSYDAEGNPSGYDSSPAHIHAYHPLFNPHGYHSEHNPNGYDPQHNPDMYHETYNRSGRYIPGPTNESSDEDEDEEEAGGNGSEIRVVGKKMEKEEAVSMALPGKTQEHQSTQGRSPAEMSVAMRCSCALPTVEKDLMTESTTDVYRNWRQIRNMLPNSYKWDMAFESLLGSDGLYQGSWTCAPVDMDVSEQIPLTIAGCPVVVPVDYTWPPVGGLNPPPDPRSLAPIDPRASMTSDIISDLFKTFEASYGFYVLINGLLQVLVPPDFDTEWAASHLPHDYGGLKVCYITQSLHPTMQTVSEAHVEQSTAGSSNVSVTAGNVVPGRVLSRSSLPTLKINDHITAHATSIKDRFQGRIGLKVTKDNFPFLLMSSHVITEAILAKPSLSSLFGNDKLRGDWNKEIDVRAANTKVGKSFLFQQSLR